jgi:hypothetical protein
VNGQTGEIFQSDLAADLTSALGRASALVGRPEVRERCRATVERYSVEQAAAGIAQAYAAVAVAGAAA